MLQQTHNIDVDDRLYLLAMHAERKKYEIVQCRDLRSEARRLLELEYAVAMRGSGLSGSTGDDEVAVKRPERAPIAVLAIDIETHGWVDGRSECANWIGPFGKPAWTSQVDLEFARVVQLGWCAFDADGAVLERCELCVSDAPPCDYKAVVYHHLSDSMLRSRGFPISYVLARLLVALRDTAREGGTIVSHGLEFDAGHLLREYQRIESVCVTGVRLLTQLAQAGACTFGMAYALQTEPRVKEKPSLSWTCERVGVAMLDRQPNSRPHTALYDAEMHGRLYFRLKAMEANGEPIYGHLPPGVAPAADASKEATYFPDLNQLPAVRKKVKALGAEFDQPSDRWYVPAGVSLAPFAEWLVRPADALEERTIIDYDMGAMCERQKEVTALGALFDSELRRWYIPAGLSLAPFQEYLRPPEPTYIEIDMRYKPAQRKQIGALGGKFDGQRQRWYVPAGQSVAPFAKWLP